MNVQHETKQTTSVTICHLQFLLTASVQSASFPLHPTWSPEKAKGPSPYSQHTQRTSNLGEGTNQASKSTEAYNKLDYTTKPLSCSWPNIKLNQGVLICKLLICFYQNFCQQDRSLIVQILSICTTQFKAVRNLTEYILVLQALHYVSKNCFL